MCLLVVLCACSIIRGNTTPATRHMMMITSGARAATPNTRSLWPRRCVPHRQTARALCHRQKFGYNQVINMHTNVSRARERMCILYSSFFRVKFAIVSSSLRRISSMRDASCGGPAVRRGSRSASQCLAPRVRARRCRGFSAWPIRNRCRNVAAMLVCVFGCCIKCARAATPFAY